MYTKTKYCADDNTEFDSLEECAKYENKLFTIRKLMEPLGPELKEDNNWIQHDPTVVRKAYLAVLKECAFMHPRLREIAADPTGVHKSHIEYLISDCAPGKLGRLFHRFSCTNDQGQEFGQPYYANHPDECPGVRER